MKAVPAKASHEQRLTSTLADSNSRPCLHWFDLIEKDHMVNLNQLWNQVEQASSIVDSDQ
jgi:hypothetical protein